MVSNRWEKRMSVDSENSLATEVLVAAVTTPLWVATTALGAVGSLSNLAVAALRRLS